VSISDHSAEWYADNNGGGVTIVFATSDGHVLGSYEHEASDAWYVVTESRVVGGIPLVVEVMDAATALLTILSRWELL
jgi:hypothetical protein